MARRLYQTIKDLAVLYAVAGSLAYAPLTGHQSLDLTLGLSKPTQLEKIFLDKLGFEIKAPETQPRAATTGHVSADVYRAKSGASQ